MSKSGEIAASGKTCVIGPNVRIGNNVKIQNNVSVYRGVTLEDDVFCGPSMVFTNVLTPRSAFPRDPDEDFLPTLVGRGATIGANATIVCGVDDRRPGDDRRRFGCDPRRAATCLGLRQPGGASRLGLRVRVDPRI